jgi:nucleoside-diphosphate-sugar epimerase
VEKAQTLLEWEAKVELVDGLERTVRWLREQ